LGHNGKKDLKNLIKIFLGGKKNEDDVTATTFVNFNG
jgi:hypothetical protein